MKYRIFKLVTTEQSFIEVPNFKGSVSKFQPYLLWPEFEEEFDSAEAAADFLTEWAKLNYVSIDVECVILPVYNPRLMSGK